jgi:formate dehydrogenase gamma subunit
MATKDMRDSKEKIKRFSAYRISEHLALIVLFAVLAITGLPQKFHSLSVSQSVIIAIGGIDNMRLLHHYAGLLFSLLSLQHILVNIAGIVFLRWIPSMLITFKDAVDAQHNVRYYVGMIDHPAMCGRFTYKQKCIYWIILLGGIQMIVTGFILWFPVVATKYLPGQFIPVSKVIHSNEAMLIFILMATWHIYDSIFSPDVFPFDKSIFTGHIEKKRMKREHPLELEQLMEAEDKELREPHRASQNKMPDSERQQD